MSLSDLEYFDKWIANLKENSTEIIDTKWVGWGKKDEKISPYISSGTWVTGGRTGGSCYDTGDEDRHREKAPEDEPEFTQLDRLLEKVWPAITYLQYKNLSASLIKKIESHTNDYYGNYTNEAEKRVDLAALYSYMKERNVI